MGLRLPALLLALSVLLSSCGGEDAAPPTEPGEPGSRIATVEVSPDEVVFQRDSAVDFDAVAEDQDGNRVSGVEFDWSVDDPDVASVNDTGLVRGIGPGRASVTAEAEGEEGAARFRVRSGRTVVVDSTRLELVSDSSERAAGTLRFSVREPPAPEVETGDILVGAEQGGFLRRVNAVSVSESEIVAETEQASLAQAVTEPGSFSTTVRLGPGARARRVERNGVVWGPVYTRYTARGVTVSSGELKIEDLTLLDGEVCSESGTACVSAEITVDSGRVAFTPDMEVSAEFSVVDGVERFRGVGRGKLEFDAAATGSATGEFSKSGEQELHQFARPFTAFVGGVPVQGEVRLTFIAGYEAGAEATYSVHTGFNSSLDTELGAELSGDGWSTVFAVQDSFETLPVRRDLTGKAHAKVFVEPEFSVIFYTVAGPTASAVPYLKGEATVDPDKACEFELSTGMDGILGFDVEVLGEEVASYSDTASIDTTTLLTEQLGCTGNLWVANETTGPAPSSYSVTLDGDTTATLAVDDSLLFEDLALGDHQVTLDDVGGDCVLSGPHSRTLSLGPGETGRTLYSVGCDVSGWRGVGVGDAHNCGVTVEDRLYCWGSGEKTGTDPKTEHETEHVPAAVRLEAAIQSVSAGGEHTCALTPAGEAYCWGDNANGELGDGTTEFRQLPVPVDTDLRFSQIDVSENSTCALTDEGVAYCWGAGGCGLGVGGEQCEEVEGRLTPAEVETNLTFTEIRVGGGPTVAVTADGRGYCWGLSCGEFVVGDDYAVPQELQGDRHWRTLDAYLGIICGVTTDNEAYCGNESGIGKDSLMLGTGEGIVDADTLVKVAGGHRFRAVRVGLRHVCGVTVDDRAFCWGQNLLGELGDGTEGREEHREVPTPVVGDLSFEALQAGVGTGGRHTCGVTTGGEAYCWGSDEDGKLGDGNPEDEAEKHDHTTPMKVRPPGGG